jgi:Leucine-rich repeat (LRR) protein
MKKKITFLFLLLTNLVFFAQTTYVPDDNFEQALINLGYDSGTLNNYVPTNNIRNIISLDISSKGITDLTGIEDFYQLRILYCNNNQLSTINLSQNTLLEWLYCRSNQLISLDVSENPNLTKLNCKNNQLTILNVKNGNNNNFLFFYAENNPYLTCIEVDNAAYSTTNWTNIDAQSYFSTNCGYTYIPDDNFEQVLINLGLDTVLDNYVTTANISSLLLLDISNNNITNLTGIEDFIALEDFNCSSNNIHNIDISQNTLLTKLHCENNSISTLDISQNINLTNLNCSNNLLTSLELTQNIGLKFLNCYDNQLTNIDLSQNTTLFALNCSSNYLTNIDLTHNTQLGDIYLQFNLITNLNVSQNTVLESLNCANNQLDFLNVKNGVNTDFSLFDTTNNPNLTCIEVDSPSWSTTNWVNIDSQSYFSTDCGNTYIPDDNFEQALIDLGIDSGALNNYIPTANINNIVSLDVGNLNITDLTGIEDFISLNSLRCEDNLLTSIDITQCPNLSFFVCDNNLLTTVDTTNNTELTVISCRENQITTLNMTHNLDLETLNCSNNLLTSLDISQNINLDFLAFSDNQLTSINTTQQPNLNWLNCNNNQLTTLDISQNIALTNLYCYNNVLTNIDLSQNIALTNLRCYNNALTNIDLSQNILLEDLRCYDNQITSIDLSLNTVLIRLWAENNQLTSLNIKNGNNTMMTDYSFKANNNPALTCIVVDDASWSVANWSFIDATSTFVNNLTECNTLATQEIKPNLDFNIYPNPVQHKFSIQTKEEIVAIIIYDYYGKIIAQFNSQEIYSTSNLSSGLYIIKIISKRGFGTKKLIIK